MATHFELLDTQKIDALNIEVERYRHLGTGASHVHLSRTTRTTPLPSRF